MKRLALASFALLGACRPTRAPLPAPAPSASASAPAPLVTSGWAGPRARFRSLRQGIAIVLPDASAWTADDAKTSWLVLGHPSTSTWLRLRVDREEHAANRDRCEASVRRLHDLASPTWGETVDEGEEAFPGWHSRWRSAVQRDPKRPGVVTAKVVAFGARIRKCLAVEVVTEGPADVVGVRLGEIREALRSVTSDDETHGPGAEPR